MYRPNIHDIPNPFVININDEKRNKAIKTAAIVAHNASSSASLFSDFANCIVEKKKMNDTIKIMDRVHLAQIRIIHELKTSLKERNTVNLKNDNSH